VVGIKLRLYPAVGFSVSGGEPEAFVLVIQSVSQSVSQLCCLAYFECSCHVFTLR
jgi:hypothetical protein